MKIFTYFLISLFFSIQLNAASEAQIKAVFLKKFTHLIEWPKSNRADFTICVLSDKSFAKELKSIYSKKKFKTKTVKIINIASHVNIPDCQLLFIGKNVKDIKKVTHSISKRPILTVSDQKDFAHDNVMITMYLNQNRFKYIINNKTAKSVDIKISYLLLKTALEVIK